MKFQAAVSQPVVAAFCAGGVAGAVSRTVVSPLERLKILFQVQSAGRDAYKLSVGKALAKMWKEEGWRGFMRGNGTNCIRIVPYSAVQFGSYNFYKRVCNPRSPVWTQWWCLVVRGLSELTGSLAAEFLRETPWGLADPFITLNMWRHRWYHFGHLHLSFGYRAHASLDSVCFVCRARGETEEASRDVANHGHDVQDRRGLCRPLQRNRAHSCWCCAIRMGSNGNSAHRLKLTGG